MKEHDATLGVLDPPPKKMSDSSGFNGPDEDTVTGPQQGDRPLSMRWMTDDLLAETIELWSQAYGRPIGQEEAVEILMNVKRMGELMLELRKEIDAT